MTRAGTLCSGVLEDHWGSFTALGGEVVERQATHLARSVARVVGEAVSPDDVRSLVLLGGYGRGEGGVERTGGQERLLNNLDLLLILKGGRSRLLPSQERQVRSSFDELERRFGVGIDFTTKSEAYFRRAPCLVMWYDMRFGHKVLLGDRDFVRGMSRFDLSRILPSDVRNLLANRATLLVLNDFILDQDTWDRPSHGRAILRHAAKAIIGYGDALLFFHGRYHWSYREKLERMQALEAAPREFRKLYAQAAAFRFAPSYDGPAVRQPLQWMSNLREVLAPIHRTCESLRLGLPGLAWSDYASVVVRKELRTDLFVPRRTARKLANLARGSAGSAWEGAGLVDRVAARAVGVQGLLPVALPALLYPGAHVEMAAPAARILGTSSLEPRVLRRAFLRTWRDTADPNLDLALRRLDIDPVRLDEPSTGARGVPSKESPVVAGGTPEASEPFLAGTWTAEVLT